MKNFSSILTFITLMILGTESHAQRHPYEQFGTAEYFPILTLSKGKYDELFDTDTIEIIGSAILNTNTMKVIGFVEKDTLYSEATLEPEVVSRFLSMDPLASKYPELNPYNFVGNNPIMFVDHRGDSISIHYTASDGTSKYYNYRSGLEVPNNNYLRETIAALDMIAEVDVQHIKVDNKQFPAPAGVLNKIAEDKNFNVNIYQSDGKQQHVPPQGLTIDNFMEPKETSILFDAYSAKKSIAVKEGGIPYAEAYLPPASALNHELKHAFNFLYFRKIYFASKEPKNFGNGFPNAEEYNTTLFTDNDFNAYHGLGTRTTYFIEPFKSTSSTSTVPDITSYDNEEIQIENNSTWLPED